MVVDVAQSTKAPKAMTQAEADGVSFFTTTFAPAVRTKLVYAFRDVLDMPEDREYAAHRARAVVLRDEGMGPLNPKGSGVTPGFG
jgi:hypothetical protein